MNAKWISYPVSYPKRAKLFVAVFLIALLAGFVLVRSVRSQEIESLQAQSRLCEGSLLIAEAPSPPKAFTGPVFLSPGQYTSDFNQQFLELRPLYVRVIAAGPHIETYNEQVQAIAQIDEQGITKMIGFSSYRDLQEKLSQPGPPGFSTHAQYLHGIGVVGFTYNTERGSQGNEWTPDDEMDRLFSTNPGTNSVVQYTNIVKSYGFDIILWVPYRFTADGENAPGQKNPNAEQAFSMMYQAGLSGIGLQEQYAIDHECVSERVAAFNETVLMHTNAAGGTKPFILINALMETCTDGDEFAESSCGLPPGHYPWQHCDQFIDQIADRVDAISLFDPPSQELVDFIETLRSGSTPPYQIYLPLSMKD